MTRPHEREDGGPAFAAAAGNGEWQDGMSLRDWFAGMSLMGRLASFVTDGRHPADGDKAKEIMAEACFADADAMLAARSTVKEGE